MAGEPIEPSRHEEGALSAADRVIGETRARWMLRLAGRIAGRVLGAILLVAGVMKALAPQVFAEQIADYDLVTNPVLVGVAAYAIVIAECGLGAALLANLRPRITLALTSLLLLLFLGAVGWALATGATENCGCFGPWERTPAEALVEDLVLLGLAGWAWWGRRFAPAPTNPLKLAVVGAALVAGVMLPAVASMAGVAAPGAAGVVGAETFRTLEAEELPASLAEGELLVLAMSTECQHCRDAVPSVNALAADPRMPKLVAVAFEDRVDRGLFREDYGAEYPVGEISKADMMSLVGKEFPRLFLVRDGVVVAVWDGKVPTPDEVLAARGV